MFTAFSSVRQAAVLGPLFLVTLAYFKRRLVMLVFLSPSWERKPAEKRDEGGEAQAGVRLSSHGPAHDQMKEWYLLWHLNGKGRAAAECSVGVNGIEQESRWSGQDTYLHVNQSTQVRSPEHEGVLLCGVMIKEFNASQKVSWLRSSEDFLLTQAKANCVLRQWRILEMSKFITSTVPVKQSIQSKYQG